MFVAPVKGVDTSVRQGGGSSGHAHSCDGELDVGNGFGECGIDCNQVIDGGILLNDRVRQSIKGRSHQLCLVEFSGLICTKNCVAGILAIDIAHLGKGGGPMPSNWVKCGQ